MSIYSLQNSFTDSELEFFKDNFLIFLYKNYNSQSDKVVNLMLHKYKTHFEKLKNFQFSKYFSVPLSKQDLDSLYYNNVISALNKYNVESSFTFKTYLLNNLKWSLSYNLNKFINKNQAILNTASSYEDSVNQGNFHDPAFIYNDNEDRNNDLLLQEVFDVIFAEGNSFSDLEKSLCYLKQQGYKNQEISKKLNITVKKVDNTWEKVKKKISKFFPSTSF